MKITEEMLTNFLVEQLEDDHTEFDELEEYRDYSFTEDVGMYERKIETYGYSIELVHFTIDDVKKHISGKGIATYTVRVRTTDYYGEEAMSHFVLGEEETASTFYFELDLDEEDFEKSNCEVEVGIPCDK